MSILDRPDYTEDVQIIGQDVTLDIAIESSAVTLNVDIVAQTVGYISVDIAAQSVGSIDINIAASAVTLNVDIVAQTVGAISIDITAQTLSQLNINIAASAISLNIKTTTGEHVDSDIVSSVTLNVDITAQTVGNIAIDIAAQTVGNVSINIAASAITINVQTALGEHVDTDITSSIQLNVNLAASAITLNIHETGTANVAVASSVQLDVNLAASAITLNIHETGTANVAVASSITLNIAISSSAINVPVTSAAGQHVDVDVTSSITLNIAIASSAVTLNVDITAQTVGNLAVDINAQTVGNISVDIAAATASITIGTFPFEKASENLQSNPGFEDADTGHWEAAGAGSLSATTTDAYSGSYCGLCAPAVNDTLYVRMDTFKECHPGQIIEVTAYMKADANITSSYQFVWFATTDNTLVTQELSSNYGGNYGWTAKTLRIACPDGLAKFKAGVRFSSGASAGEGRVDAFCVVRMIQPLMDTSMRLKIDVAAQTVGNIAIDIAAQTVGNIAVNIAASAVTLNIAIASSAVTLNVKTALAEHVDTDVVSSITLNVDITAQTVGNIAVDVTAQTVGNLAINIAAQGLDVDINLEGPTGGYAVEVASDFSLQQQPYSLRALITSETAKATTGGTTYTLTNTKVFRHPMLLIYSSAAQTGGSLYATFNSRDYELASTGAFTAGECRIMRLRDVNSEILETWSFGDLKYKLISNATIDIALYGTA